MFLQMVHQQQKSLKKCHKQQNIFHRRGRHATGCLAAVSVLLCSILLCGGCQKQTAEGQNKEFRKFTSQLFKQEVASDTVSLHYTLRDPEKYGIKEDKVTFGTFSTDNSSILASGENMERALETFSYEKLTEENRLTYDVLKYCVEMTQEGAKYLLYEEPLGLVSGVQTQLPVVLSEYPLETEADVNIYLELLKTTPEYFDSLLAFEQEKAKEGLFMADYALDEVIRQCNAFLEMGDNNYLISTFVDRIKKIEGLTEKEKSDYMQKNALVLKTNVMPAYNKLIAGLQDLRGSGTNEKGLCYLPEGKAYYEYVVRAGTGSERTVDEMKLLTKQQILVDLEAMERVLDLGTEGGKEEGTTDAGAADGSVESSGVEGGIVESSGAVEGIWLNESVQAAADLSSEFSTDPLVILKDLQVGIEKSFPALDGATYTVKYVPKAMEEHLSPAFYMIPAIDDYKDNVIYVNQAHMGNELTLFTTLAHEGYPGHLYQSVYFAEKNPDPVRNIFNFGGYVEGWATYAEMCSYYLTPFSKEQATLLQKNNSIMLGLYTLADIGIHYDGWSRMDTIAFFSSYGIGDPETVEQIYELIIGSPGNYLRYYIGYLEFLELKKEWAAEKGDAFSQKEFHEAVLDVGPAPFELVRKYAK